MTPPDSVGKVVAEMLEVDEAVPLDLKHWATRLQALDRQRQEEEERLTVENETLGQHLADAMTAVAEADTEAEAAEAALAEARELLHETGRYLDPRHYAAQIAKLTAFLTRTAKEPNNG